MIRSFKYVLPFLIFAGAAVSGPLEVGKAAFDQGQYDAALAAFAVGMRGGDAASGYYMARMLELGLGVEPDPGAAQGLYTQAAAGGNVAAQNRLALMYYRGELGLGQDYARAAELFESAADQGDGNAMFNLGKLYLEGKGVTRDASRAMVLYKQAAAQDHILALNSLGALYRAGARTDADRAQSKQYFERSAAFGNAVGLYELARITLEAGDDAEHQIMAHMYLNLAAARSHPNAPASLQALTDIMTTDDVLAAQAKAREFVALPAAAAAGESE